MESINSGKLAPFTPINKQVHQHPEIRPSDLSVYITISSYANKNTRKCWPARDRIAKESKVSIRTVSSSIKKLEKLGFISIERTHRNGKTLNEYTLLDTEGDVQSMQVDNGGDVQKTTCKNGGDVQSLQSNNNSYKHNNKNNKNNISKEIGISYPSHESKNNDSNNKKDGEKMLFDISHLEKRNSKKKLSKKELAYNRIENARNGHLRWDNVKKENMAYYYQEEHNKKYSYKVKVGYNRKYGTSDASVIEDIFHKQYNIPWCELPKAIDIALDVYTDVEHSPNYNNRLTPYMMYNNNTMMEKLMRQVKKELDNPNSLYGKS